ncbi:phosphoserine phosphatase SerB [Thalassotalea sp. ND16A]|uniref:phosphoserine phosphatase SerB n=1 Tax=Thalassotalea sp. ND16A TaxID=1535422 RepID=UPI00051D1FF0|nr:phosphoserine phosphatase SerB [Thalassotalea sp. ND16A]KGK00402.1 Phosphoserine phosphatase [Thalassotalea sp. ND16A]
MTLPTRFELISTTSQQPLLSVLSSYQQLLPIQLEKEDQQVSISQSFNNYNTDDVELIVFSDLTLTHLINVLALAKINRFTLTTINERAGKTSYRFKVAATSLAAKSAINDYALQHGFELALFNNAPSLSTPGLLVMDMDSTTIQIECIDEIAKLAGVGEHVSAVTERAMLGELDFAESLRERVGTLSGAPESILAEVGNKLPLMPGLEVLIQTLHQHNWKVAVASGGFTYFTEILKQQLNLDATQANVLEIVDGKLTGKVLGDITDAQVKADTLNGLAKEYGIDNHQTVAMGDGANDLVMMSAANLGVAFEAKPVVLQQATTSINFSGLDCLLHWLK